MGSSNYQLRELQKRDYSRIETLISKAWSYPLFCATDKIVKHMSRVFLQACLTDHTFAKTAVHNGEVVGVILGKKENEYHRTKNLRHYLSVIYHVLCLLVSKDGRSALKVIFNSMRTFQSLLKKNQTKFDGEVVFFVVDEKMRGMGIGKKLLQTFKEYMNESKSSSVYVFTDTTCNYKFYESQGFERIEEKKLMVPLLTQSSIQVDYFLYQINFK